MRKINHTRMSYMILYMNKRIFYIYESVITTKKNRVQIRINVQYMVSTYHMHGTLSKEKKKVTIVLLY